MADTQQPSSGSSGFFQTRPTIPNQFREDFTLNRCFKLFLTPQLQKSISPDLDRFAAYVLSPTVLRYARDSARNEPSVSHYDGFGRRVDILTTSEGWRASNATSAREGIVAIGYDKSYGRHARVYQFLKTHVWAASSCGVTCPSAMQDGASALLIKHLGSEESATDESTKKVLRDALERLLSRDPEKAWTSGQWMTERPGGSDVRNTETRARKVNDQDLKEGQGMVASDGHALGGWRIDGFKWFSSATDANMTVMLAKTDGKDTVSAFFAPTRIRPASTTGDPAAELAQSRYNGIQIQRLKSKMGTKSLPTAELVLNGMRAYLIGEEGRGVRTISSILNITRVHTGVGSCGGWGRGLAISRAYSRVRKVQGRLLMDVPAHVRSLAEQMTEYRAKMLFSFFVVSLLGVVEHNVAEADTGSAFLPGHEEATHLLRLLTPVLKSQASASAITGLRFCMESLGGLGYMENEEPELNVARLFRDTCVNSIWEGTTDVLAADTVRVLKGSHGKHSLAALKAWVNSFMQRAAGFEGKEQVVQIDIASLVTLSKQVEELEELVEKSDADDLLYNGRSTMEGLSWLVSAILLNEDAMYDSDPVACEIARRWIDKRRPASAAPTSEQESGAWRKNAQWDRQIVFGDEKSPGAAKL